MYTAVVGGGELFMKVTNSHGDQLFRGANLYALNTTTGQPVWSINGFYDQGHAGGDAIADGYFVTFNGYDNQIYVFGQGPSKTTVNAPNIDVTTATPVSITGSVTDISAGSQQDAVAANYPNGLPAVSDASQSNFMESVYMQQPMPTNITGVPVTLSVIDSNGNYRQIGTTTTNAMGNYGFSWTPDIPGDYTVIATFAGSGSYYSSSASAYFHASTVPTATPVVTAASNLATTTDLMTYIVAAAVAIIIAIAIVGILLLRKKP